MTFMELAADALARNGDMLTMTIADFTDADMLTRPCPTANHPTWQLGHLISAETRMVHGPNAPKHLPAGWTEKFTKDTAAIDDPKAFPNKAELVDQFKKTRAAAVAWVKQLKPADLENAMPENIRSFIPTVGHLVITIPAHAAMHIGQFQVLRRKLGKPLLF